MSDRDPLLIDGKTGAVIGPIPRAAKQAKQTFVGETEKGKSVVRTKVVRRYRGLVQPPITNRNYVRPTADQIVSKLERDAAMIGKDLARGMKRGEPIINTLASVILRELFKKMEGK